MSAVTRIYLWLILSMIVALAPLSLRADNLDSHMITQDEAMRNVADYVRAHTPNGSRLLANYEAVVVDQGWFWGVFFKKPGPLQIGGGTPEFHVDKKSGVVTEAGISQ